VPRACLVTFTNPQTGVQRSVEVLAESLYEAGALGVRALRDHAWTEGLGPASKITVEAREPSVQHVVTVEQIRRWANGVARSPNEKITKDRVREMLSR
jgi:hypothetical protein